VTPHLPELARLKILVGFDDEDKPVLKDRTKPISLRYVSQQHIQVRRGKKGKPDRVITGNC
jgi:hypothetical protein